MSAFDFPILDGVAPSFADITVRASPTIGGPLIEMGDIVSIDTGWAVEIGEQREGGRVINRTRGDVSYTAQMVLYASGFQKLKRGLQLAAPPTARNVQGQLLISLVQFNINVQFTPPGAIDILEYHIKGCRVSSRDLNAAEGTEATRVTLALNPLQVVDIIDGVQVVAV